MGRYLRRRRVVRGVGGRRRSRDRVVRWLVVVRMVLLLSMLAHRWAFVLAMLMWIWCVVAVVLVAVVLWHLRLNLKRAT
jgi:hypothetical protein